MVERTTPKPDERIQEIINLTQQRAPAEEILAKVGLLPEGLRVTASLAICYAIGLPLIAKTGRFVSISTGQTGSAHST